MDFRQLLNLVFTVFVTAALVMAPLTTPANAIQQRASMMDMGMSADMPCCPDEQNNKDCQDCPLIAVCMMLKTAQAGPSSAEALPVRHPIRTEHSFIDDASAAGLVRPPPDHPPRA